MSLAILSFSILVILSNFVLENVDGQTRDSYTVFQALQNLSKAVERLEAKIQLQTSSMNNIEATVEIQAHRLSSVEALLNDLAATQLNLLNNLEEKVNVLQATILEDFKAESKAQKTLLSNIANTTGVQGNLLTKLEDKLAEQFSNLQAQTNEQGTLLQKLDEKADMQAALLSNLVAEAGWHEPVAQFKTNRTVVAWEGDDVEIWCVVRGTPLPDITWTRENGALASDRVVVENNGKSLRIKNARLSDEGTYDCVAANGVGIPATQSVGLHVYGHARQCQGMIESDKGSLEIEPSSASRLCIIKLQHMNRFRIEFDPLMSEPIAVIPEQSPSGSNAQFIQIYGSKNVSYEFEGKSLVVVLPPGLERTSLNWTGLDTNVSELKSSTKYVNDFEGALDWDSARDGTDKILWAFDLKLPGELNWTLNTEFTAQDQDSSCDNVSFSILKVRQDWNVSEIHKTCDGSSEGSLKFERSSQVMVLLQIKSVEAAKPHLQVTWDYYDEPFKGTAEGIIVGTDPSGAVVIPFNSTQTKTPSSKVVYGLAFDWNSHRIYWVERGIGILRARWDGGQTEVLLLDTFSTIRGMAIEPISGNIYYANNSSKLIRICNNDATRCSSIANSTDLSSVQDIAVHRSKGFLFWSIWEQKIVRANLDGSNATVILQRNVTRIDVDEYEDRLYWGSPEGIGSCDLNGQDVRIMPSLNTHVQDVAIDGENVYYTAWHTKSINVTSKLGSNSRLVAELQSAVYHLAFFGTQDHNQRPNPCENSECAHLCSLITHRSYRCLCPENQELDPNGKTCNL